MTFVLFLHKKNLIACFLLKFDFFWKQQQKFFFHIFSNNEQNLIYDTSKCKLALNFD